MSVCARVFAATLMAGAIVGALAFPAFVGDRSPTPYALTAPPSSAHQTVRVPASAAFARVGRSSSATRRHAQLRRDSSTSLAAVRISRSSRSSGALHPSGFGHSPRPAPPAGPAATPPPRNPDEPTPVPTLPSPAPQPTTPPPAPQPQDQTRQLAAVPAPPAAPPVVTPPPPPATPPVVVPPVTPPPSDPGDGCDDHDGGHGNGHGHAYGHEKNHDRHGDDDQGDDGDGRDDD